MEKHKQKTAFNSVIILTVTMLIVKILSAIYRVPYQNVLGDTGLYAYQQVYPIVAIVSVLSINAIPSVISQNQYQKVSIKYLYKITTVISFMMLVLLILFSDFIAVLMGDKHLNGMLKMAAFVLLPFPFVAFARGYLQKHHHMETIAYSQVVDQTVRVTTIILGIVLFSVCHLSIYESGMISVLGSTLGLLSCFIYLKWMKGTSIYPKLNIINTSPDNKKILKQFLTLSIFYSLSYLVMILWQLADSFTIINLLKRNYSLVDARNLKGVYDRGSSLIQMGLIVTTSFSLVLIPLLAESKHKRQYRLMNDYASSALKITIIFSSAAAVGLINLMVPFNVFLFKTSHGFMSLMIYMLAIIFVSMIIMYTAMLQIYQRYQIQLIAVITGLFTKVLLNIILVPILNINGASIATVLGLLVYTSILHLSIKRIYHLNFKSFIMKWSVTLTAMSMMIQILMLIPFHGRLQALLLSLTGVSLGIIVVIYAMIKLSVISEKEWSYLPYGHIMIKFMNGR